MYYFIYETVNIINGKKYRGYHSTKNIDDGYIGSGSAIKSAINKYGKENFIRIILEFCDSLDSVIIREKFYVNEEWVKDRNNYNLTTGGKKIRQTEYSKKELGIILKNKYYLGEINLFGKKFGDKSTPLSKSTKDKISKTLKEKWKNIEHPNKGKSPINKGKKNLYPAWNKGLKTGPMSEEEKEKRSNTLKERYKKETNPRKGRKFPNEIKNRGKIPWNKGTISDSFECEYCKRQISGKINLIRWHGNNCKSKN